MFLILFSFSTSLFVETIVVTLFFIVVFCSIYIDLFSVI